MSAVTAVEQHLRVMLNNHSTRISRETRHAWPAGPLVCIHHSQTRLLAELRHICCVASLDQCKHILHNT
jgi:hypothetical protein